jgi:non-heme Fe2+,alpha-ketoglutarate-dependent halogenase
MKALSQEQVDSYRYNGFLFPVPALTPDEVATCLAGLQRFEQELGSPVAEADVKWRSHAYAHSPWFNTLIRHKRILDAIEDVIGPNILVWTSTFFIKEPHSPTFAAWHQDGTYFGLEPKEQVCAWVASRTRWRRRCVRASSHCTTSLQCTVPRQTTHRIGGSGSA